MEKKFLLVGLVLFAIPGCGDCHRRGRKTVIVPTEYREKPACAQSSCRDNSCREECVEMPDRVAEEPLAEDIEGFVLEEPGVTFTLPDQAADQEPMLEPQEGDEAWLDQRMEQAQQHGFKTAYFGFDDYAVRPDQKMMLDYNLKKISEATKKGSTIVIEGHACRFAGSAVYNMMLSEKRAEAVAQYLVGQGVPREKIKVVGRGYEMCMVPEGDMEQQAPNRRVEFYVLSDKDELRELQMDEAGLDQAEPEAEEVNQA